MIKENEFLICSETQDFAMVPYDKITYQVQDDTDCTFAAIIAVLPETPPNCIVIQVRDLIILLYATKAVVHSSEDTFDNP